MSNFSNLLFERAQNVIPGGVNSPVRAFRGVGGTPQFIKSAKGSYLIDVDDKKYIDYVGSWGPMILGHSHPEVIQALHKAIDNGTSYGAPTEIEVEIAELITSLIPSIEKIRMVSSGTEATMSAIRLARGFTKRNKIIKFIGCYHGHADALLVKAGSGIATLGLPDSAGVPIETAQHTIALPFNNLEVIKQTFELYPNDIAAVIIEPVVGNMGCIPPLPGYLEGIRNLTKEYGSLLIFDEVMTGFRLALGGAQQFYSIIPDLTCLGKIIGGGLPAAGYGGRKDIMDYIAPVGPVYQAGTLSGNPLAMTAGFVTIQLLQQSNIYENLRRRSEKLIRGISQAATKHDIPTVFNYVGSMFTLFFSSESVSDWESAKKSDTKMFGRFFHAMLEKGIYFPPSQFESAFLSLAHTDEIIEETIAIAEEVFKEFKSK